MKMKPVNRTLAVTFLLTMMLPACHQNQDAPSPQQTPRSEPVHPVQTPTQQAAAITGESSVKMSGGMVSTKMAKFAPGPDGEQVYNQVCVACHGTGVAGAPKVGDQGAWKPRIAKGTQTLVNHAIHGFTGDMGLMPPKGGALSLSDSEVEAAVHYMVKQSR